MSLLFSPARLSRIETAGIIAVLVIDRAVDALPLAEALASGGIEVIELALRTPDSLAALREIKKRFPFMLVGAGTVLAPTQIPQVIDAGAEFAVAPGCNPRVLAAAAAANISFAPGIVTPSDIETAVEHGCNLLKFFPAEPSGGLSYLKNMTAPYAHLGLRYIPLGGIGETTAAAYLDEPSVIALGGSWIAPRELIQKKDFVEIAARAQRARDLVLKIRSTR
ncbi:MAG: bifunctional 4-hydroxy-2-oxoglutarate aldolase/2-dehydro-3-deoxy-phosphogluconate aldolase [Rariglobus sp.]|nr:bifunctional 4-hydroxy-2-oxoglutarate aldolase/2-dehydro-3-deoxy-phosphogluconate aldolase [Rariglobus sp.]